MGKPEIVQEIDYALCHDEHNMPRRSLDDVIDFLQNGRKGSIEESRKGDMEEFPDFVLFLKTDSGAAALRFGYGRLTDVPHFEAYVDIPASSFSRYMQMYKEKQEQLHERFTKALNDYFNRDHFKRRGINMFVKPFPQHHQKRMPGERYLELLKQKRPTTLYEVIKYPQLTTDILSFDDITTNIKYSLFIIMRMLNGTPGVETVAYNKHDRNNMTNNLTENFVVINDISGASNFLVSNGHRVLVINYRGEEYKRRNSAGEFNSFREEIEKKLFDV